MRADEIIVICVAGVEFVIAGVNIAGVVNRRGLLRRVICKLPPGVGVENRRNRNRRVLMELCAAKVGHLQR